MDENRIRESSEQDSTQHESARANRWLIVLVVALVAAGVFSFAYAHRETEAVAQLTGNNQQMSSTISDMRAQLDALNQKLVTMTTPPAPAPAETHAGAAKPAVKRTGVSDRRLKQIQSELSAQKEELQRTENDLAEARTGLYGELNSTRSELSGSIAKTHEELVALEQRGERNYFEFDLSKSKTFSRSGPISISVRRTDTKHNNFDVVLLVDDNKLDKKHVNLYEPVWIHSADDTQPVQLVVNKISKNHVNGYVSAPKYAQSRAHAAAASTTPAALDISTTPVPTPAVGTESQHTQPSTE